ncbi:MAG: FAD-dependent oxidoreductase, partial [Burkholderiales bacterium]
LRAGRAVTLSVGTHVRLPRRYRGKDILHWMVNMGAFRAAADPAGERESPPPQIVGSREIRDLDLDVLQRLGARLVGRTIAASGTRVSFAADLSESVEKADDQMAQLLSKIDAYIAANGLESVAEPEALRRVQVAEQPRQLCLREAGIKSIVWATGYQRRYPWLKLPVLDERGEIRHRRGVTPEPGLYVLGMRFQATKGSNLIDGVGADAEEIADHLAARSHVRQAA